ncbi:K(+)-transporting ATPase subunit F [Rhodococcus hoagii]|uniref:K(+)-transporting ATPase subunit F n=1 Tax=Rhodococcus hoagii TaxID=43767 RepID=A0A9Q4ZDL4_RHOHA|nr:K(+)-transporting ATPase subunit F [Prescottella equi]MBU4613679.1 K(+)-transporting ATPase subunit F [Rhodococcus sp. GG48]MCD7051613.1 K(+)-transporting ATPase subunit F [Rhodococcus sp. BH2-1]GBF13127.1 F subunit of K+-transporting ATPase [Rhodococcus sp. Br-6]AVP69352.1 K(+)-transporting ATPase subunit F [Prescottella equi]MBM4473225.1 K(+)-transporting ATPase subunit F [Prescottella equi]
MTVAGTVGVAVVVIAAALVIYLLIALLNPERF